MAFFRAFSTIGPPDHGKEASLAGWVEDVRNLGGIAFLIVRQRGGTFQVTAVTAGFNAKISLKTAGNKQTVSIRADSQFRAANITLSK